MIKEIVENTNKIFKHLRTYFYTYENMNTSLSRLKRYIKYTEAFRDFDEIFKDLMTEDSKIRLQQFFNNVNDMLNSSKTTGEIIEEIKQQHNETLDNMIWKDGKLMTIKIEYEFERLITQLKISRDSSMSELLSRVDIMTPEEIKSFM